MIIDAGSVVNKSFTENNITVVGVPACKIKDTGDLSYYHRVCSVYLLRKSIEI